MLLLIAVLAATGAQAQVDLHGILTTGNHTARVDSVSLEVGGAQMFLTPGWGGDPGVVDSFDFPSLPIWPIMAVIFGDVDGAMTITLCAPFVPDTWYVIGDPGPGETRVLFWRSAGIKELPGVGARSALSVTPSVLTGHALVRGQVSAGRPFSLSVFDAAGNTVRTFRAAPDPAAGVVEAVWRGRDDAGRVLPEGVYFCRLATGGAVAVRKVLIAR
jgi:hypothetical protein